MPTALGICGCATVPSVSRDRSVAFDRAAETYDATRSLAGPAREEVARLLVGELAGRGRCLEIGIGTGRMALPLVAHGVPIAGVDLSVPMLRKLAENAGGRFPFPVAVADATRLPFGSHRFGAALVVHVLHLVPDWPVVLDELARVVRPGGVAVLDLGSATAVPDGAGRAIQDRFLREAGIVRPYVGLMREDLPRFDECVARLGWRRRDLSPVQREDRGSIASVLAWLERGEPSWTWSLDADARHRAVAGVRDWATRAFGDLEAPRAFREEIRIRAYDLP